MATPSSDSDGPPEIPDEDRPSHSTFARKTSVQNNYNVHTQIHQPAPPHHVAALVGAKRVQRSILPQPAVQTACKQHERDPNASAKTDQEDLCLAVPLEDGNCVLRATPERLEFQMDCRNPYTLKGAKPLRQEIVLQNVSNHTVSFVVFPPSSKAFSLSCPQKKPFLSAGMQQRMQVSFCPDVYAPQADFIKVVVSIRSVHDAVTGSSRKQSGKDRRFEDSLFLKRIPLRAVVHCRVKEDNPIAPPTTISNEVYECRTDGEFVPFSILCSLDFGETKVGSVRQRRLVLPAALWAPVEFTVKLTKQNRAFSVNPLNGIIGPREHVILWLQFAPSLHIEYTDELLVFLGPNANPHRVALKGNGVPLQTESQSALTRRKSCQMLENSPRLESSTRFAEKHSSTTQAAKEINYSQQIGESLGFPSSMDNPREQMKPETCAETSAAESSMNLTDDRPNQPFIAHALKCPSRRRECVAKGTSYTVTPTSAAKRLDSTKYGEGAISKQYLDERWADLVAVLRAQKLGTQTVKGGALPSDAAVQKIQLKRAEEVQRMLRLLQIQDRNRSSCVFAGAPVAPSRTATQSTLHSTCSSQEKGSMVRKLWRSELIIRFQQAAAAVVLRTRMARRLEAIRSWIRSHNLREEANQPGAPEKQHQNGPSNCLNSPQHPGHDLEKGFHQRAPVHTNTPQQNEKFVGGLPKCQGNASLAGSTVVEVPTVVKSVEGSAGLQGQESHGVTDEYRWRVKLVPPRFSFLADSNGEWEWQSIPGPEFWGKENLNVAELFTCMQHNAPLSALSKRDVDVFHLKEEDVITCTGGLEVTDMDLLQSLLDATPPLIDDKTWVRCMPSSKHALDDAKTSLTTRSRSQGVNGTLDTAGLLPPEEPSALAAVAWRFVASAPPYSSACMQVPHIIETDLAYIILQAAAQAETNHAAENILPPFSEIPPLRCSMSELNSVAAGALWPPGAHQTLIRASHRSFDEQGGDKRRESAGIDALEPTEEKDSHALAFEECVNRADALKRDSKILASIWGLARCEQVELLSGVNRTLPQEFQIPYL